MGMKRILAVLVTGIVVAGPSQVATAQSSNTFVLGVSRVYRGRDLQ
jgi:hypothetical protein